MNEQAKVDAAVELIMNARLWQKHFVPEPTCLDDGFAAISRAVSHVGLNTDSNDMVTACKVVTCLLVACEQFMYTLPTTDNLDETLISVLKTGWQIGNQTS